MATPTTKSREKEKLLLDPGRRRSMRVLLSVPIHVNGRDKNSQEFQEETRTLVVNAHGALISLAAQIVAGQQLMVSNKSTNMTLECRVVHLENASAGRVQTGIEFVKPCPSFWQIDFPPDDWVAAEE